MSYLKPILVFSTIDLLKTHKRSLFETYHQNYTKITPFLLYNVVRFVLKLSGVVQVV